MSARVRYGRLSRHARDVIRWWYGGPVTIAGYVRYWFPDGVWRGDSCGCPDDRCIGFHHERPDDCHCLEVTLSEYAVWAQGLPGLRPDRAAGRGRPPVRPQPTRPGARPHRLRRCPVTARPRVAAAHLAAAAARLFSTVLLDAADLTMGPAIYKPRLRAFVDLDGNEIGPDSDPSLVVLVEPGHVDQLVRRHGTPGRAAQALTRDLRKAGVL